MSNEAVHATQELGEPVPAEPQGAHADRLWVGMLSVGLAAIGAYYVLPRGGAAQAFVLCLVNATGAVAAYRAAARSRALIRLVWISLGASMTLSTVANIPYYAFPLITGRSLPFPSAVDAFWLLTYPCFVAALFALVYQRRGDDKAGNALDAMILVVGGSTLMWEFILGPAVHSTGLPRLAHLVSTLYPTMDLIVFAMLIRLLVASGRNGSMRLLLVSFISLLTADAVYTVMLSHGSYQLGGPTDGLWMLSYLLIGVASVHPTATALPQSTHAHNRVSPGRVAFLGAALLVGPVLIVTRPHEVTFIAWSSGVSFLLVMTRMTWLNRRLLSVSMEVERKTDELHHQAMHDGLTGLPNRALILDRIEQALARSRRQHAPIALLFLDLDGFKAINDTFGHAAGDKLLRAMSARLTALLRASDTVGRLGGDEFVVLVEGVSLDAGPEVVADRIRDVLAEAFHVGSGNEYAVNVKTSIGIAIGIRDSAEELLHDADVALYAAKDAGRDQYVVFAPELQALIHERRQLEVDLRAAVGSDQFFLVYQPTFNLLSSSITGVEALIRWQHPTRGLVLPDEFIFLAEETSLIVPIGRWVLGEACRQAAEWSRRGNHLSVSVNVSGRQLDKDVDFVAEVHAALTASGLDPRLLTLEITETMIMRDADVSTRRLHALKALGVRIAIDDFGTGYSSLAYLRQFPVDTLKIDRSFIGAIADDEESAALIRAMIQLGKALGIETLAEGIEEDTQLQSLLRENCDSGQGYLFARPLRPDALEEFVSTISTKRERPRAAATAASSKS
jgi:diguanylate cyclase (GGDEF)-like protein